MADILGNATSPQLLILIAIPLVGALFFTAIIVVSLNRRRKKSQMKLGVQSRSSLPSETLAPPSAKDLNTSLISQPPPTIETGPQALPAEQTSPKVRTTSSVSSIEPEISLDLLSRKRGAEVSPQDVQQSNEEERILNTHPKDPARTVPAEFPEPVELLRLLRHPESGQLIVEVAGQHYLKLVDVADKDVGQYILKLAAHLLAFTNGMIGTAAGVKSVYNPKVGQVPRPIEAAPSAPEPPQTRTSPASPSPPLEPKPAAPEPGPAPTPPPETEAAFLGSLRDQPTQPEAPQNRGLFGRTPSAPKPTLLSLNLADEINKIAQARLAASPLAATTDLEITSGLDRGIRIKVNGQIYASPDDIPDPEVTELIKASIKQWERS